MIDPKQEICRLHYTDTKSGDELTFVVENKDGIIGRSSDCDWVLNHESVSRAHAQLSRREERWFITDLESKNGVRINTFRVQEEAIRDGDRIDLGTAQLIVEIKPVDSPTRSGQVQFIENELPNQHTEIFEMSGLSSLLVASGQKPSALSGLGQASEDGTKERGSLAQYEGDAMIRLVSEAAEALISCESLDQTLERILALVFNNLPAERGLICLHDEENPSRQPNVMRTKSGIPDEPIQVSSNIVSHVLEKKQALLVRNTLTDDRFGAAQSVIMMDIHSAMCAPLYREDRVAGFIYVDRQSGNEPFETEHLLALSALAVISAVAVETAVLRDSIRHEQELRSRLARYSSPTVVDQILKGPNSGALDMVTDEREITVLFADLEGFTALAENLPPADVIRMLNRVFERLTQVVFSLEGTLDKFQGDGMMAFFGAPLAMPDHAERAVKAALQMQKALDELNPEGTEENSIRMRIGINSGSAVVGDIGSPQRKDYTVIGDVVNTASRLESEVARSGQIIVGESTWERVRSTFDCEPLGELQLKGKQKKVSPFRVIRLSQN